MPSVTNPTRPLSDPVIVGFAAIAFAVTIFYSGPGANLSILVAFTVIMFAGCGFWLRAAIREGQLRVGWMHAAMLLFCTMLIANWLLSSIRFTSSGSYWHFRLRTLF